MVILANEAGTIDHLNLLLPWSSESSLTRGIPDC